MLACLSTYSWIEKFNSEFRLAHLMEEIDTEGFREAAGCIILWIDGKTNDKTDTKLMWVPLGMIYKKRA